MINSSTLKNRESRLKNGLINVDTSMNNCQNWINLAKERLKERERKLLMIRISTIESIINDRNKNINYKISIEFINCLLNDSLFPIIDKWQGINIWRTKKLLNEFKNYFLRAKNWWDINKQQAIASLFWIPVFKNIRKKLAKYSHSNDFIFLVVIRALFEGNVKYPGTKQQSLINSSIIINSQDIQKYFFKLHQSLNIKQWIMTDKLNNNNNKYRQIGKIVLDTMKNTLDEIIKNLDDSCLEETTIEPPQIPNSHHSSTNRSDLYQHNNLQQNMYNVNGPIVNPFINPMINNNNNAYNGSHAANSYFPANIRYNPMNTCNDINIFILPNGDVYYVIT